MQKLRNAFKFKREATVTSEDEPQTYIVPFVVVSFLVLPMLVVTAFSKSTVSFDVLVSLGYYSLIQAFFWLMVTLTVVFGLSYLVKGRGRLNKACVAMVAAAVVGLFVFVLLP